MTNRIEKLHPRHAVAPFDCGQEALNRFLHKHALQSQHSRGAQTYVGLVDSTVVGYYTLAVGSVEYGQAPERVKKGLAKHSILIMLLARLALDLRRQQQGVGAGLLKDAMLRTLQAADIAGIRALVVHAKNETARTFYERFDFLPSPTDPLHLFMLLKDLRRLGSWSRRFVIAVSPVERDHHHPAGPGSTLRERGRPQNLIPKKLPCILNLFSSC